MMKIQPRVSIGISSSLEALLYLALVMGGVFWSAGAWSRGILEANGTFDAQPIEKIDGKSMGKIPMENPGI